MEITGTDVVARRRVGLLTVLRARLHLLALVAVALLAGGLRCYNLAALGAGNLYYTAGVASMLQSWSNFFFVAAEPGGSVSIDKPPLGLWVQAASAFCLGLNGFAVILPQLVAGVLAVLLLYHLVGRRFGRWPGLLAALALAVTPAAVAADRNNTMDSLLVLTLLLAAWAWIKATETGRLRYLLLGAAIVGLGFNIKMFQAYLPLPAFFGLYLLGARVGWWRKLGQLALAGVVLLAVSLSWALVVDLTPASMRPYVGSSSDNTVTELIIGHNGLERLFGRGGPGGTAEGGLSQQPLAGMPAGPGDGARPQPQAGMFGGPGGAPPAGMGGGPDGAPPAGMGGGPGGGGPGGGGPGGGDEIGQPGLLRLVSAPLSNEVSWLLPFGLAGGVLLVLRGKDLSGARHELILWGGWLITELVFFSMASFYHAYYLTMLAAPLAAMVGIAAAELWRIRERHPRLAAGLLLATAGLTLGAQYVIAGAYVSQRWWMPVAAASLVGGAALLLIAQRRRWPPLARAGFGLALAAIMLTPLVWSALGTIDPNPNVRLPHAYAGESRQGAGGMPAGEGQVDASLLSFLEQHTQGVKYLLAVPSANEGDAFVLATGRPVLYMGGFSGSDPVVSADGLARMVASGELRYVLWGGQRGGSDLGSWITSHGTLVQGVTGGGWAGTLYELRAE